MSTNLFLFHRDLRIHDNLGLLKCISESKKVICMFAFVSLQITPSKNKYFSSNSTQFLVESLRDLKKELPELVIVKVPDYKTLVREIKKNNIDNVYSNMDYTPYAKSRDNLLKRLLGSSFKSIHGDYALSNLLTTKTRTSGTMYKVFTPFYNYARKFGYKKPQSMNSNLKSKIVGGFKTNYIMNNTQMDSLYSYNKDIHVHGGRKLALRILGSIDKYNNYKKTRDYPSKSTTNLSAYIKYGCVSIREVAESVRSNEMLFRQLYWRDFYLGIAYHYPYVFGKPLKQRFESIKWRNNSKEFDAWKMGKTGFPIVDAGMRQLNKTGYMHNRTRMIVSNFLTKNLLINWTIGEQYFATQLVDYDPSVNNGNWQWNASVGTDTNPFRFMNPWTQAIKWDSNCEYIKKWVPELQNVPNSDILHWDTKWSNYTNVKYPRPIIDHSDSIRRARSVFFKKF